MNKKILIGTIIVFVGLLALLGYLKPKDPTQVKATKVTANTESKLATSETMYDFGSISMKDGKVSKIFTITNPTGEDVVITSVITSCMCTTAYLEREGKEMGPFGMPGHGGGAARIKETLKGGEVRQIRVVFDPNAHGPAGVGKIDRFVSVYDSKGGVVELEIKAFVTP